MLVGLDGACYFSPFEVARLGRDMPKVWGEAHDVLSNETGNSVQGVVSSFRLLGNQSWRAQNLNVYHFWIRDR